MKPVVIAVSILAGWPPCAVVACQDDSNAAQQEYSQVVEAYSLVSGGLRKAKTDRERQAAVEQLGGFASKFIEIAENNPKDPVALMALREAIQTVGSTDSGALQAWEMNTSDFPAGCSDGSTERTIALILRDHADSGELGPVIDRMRYAYRLEYDQCLSTVLELNPHHEIQALACLSLAQFLHDKLRMIRLVEDRPELSQCYQRVFGNDYLPRLQRLGQADLAARIEKLLERATGPYADVKFRGSTVGETAKSELYDIRHLGIGKVAPDIEGQDQDGLPFKLSDYRGKVVLLYFWSEY